MENIAIRKSACHEIKDLAETMKDAFEDDAVLYGEAPYGETPEPEITKRIKNDLCYTFYLGEEIIGGMYLQQIEDGEYRLMRLWIKRKNQNSGLGTILLGEMEKLTAGCRRISLDTPYKSYRNHHFYEKNGYIKTGERSMGSAGTGKLESHFTLFEYEKRFD